VEVLPLACGLLFEQKKRVAVLVALFLNIFL